MRSVAKPGRDGRDLAIANGVDEDIVREPINLDEDDTRDRGRGRVRSAK